MRESDEDDEEEECAMTTKTPTEEWRTAPDDSQNARRREILERAGVDRASRKMGRNRPKKCAQFDPEELPPAAV